MPRDMFHGSIEEASLNTPEPAPQPGSGPDIWELVIDDMRERNAFGYEKYKQTLKAGDGRKHLIDAYQEQLDLCVYLRQEIEEQRLHRDSRQRRVLDWAKDSFGAAATNPQERAARLVEEAIEICQALRLPPDTIARITDRVYSRPEGELWQEIGGCALTLDALAENAGISVAKEADRELRRVLSKTKEWWAKKHNDKVEAGVANLPVAECPDSPTGKHDFDSQTSAAPHKRCYFCGATI